MQTANRIGADPETITVRVPIVFRRRGGRKTVITPQGPLAIAAPHARIDFALVRAIARAFRWRRLIETGVYTSVAEIADAEKINDSYVGRVLRLSLLAPDIVEAILDGRQSSEMTLNGLMKPFSAEWAQQTRMPSTILS